VKLLALIALGIVAEIVLALAVGRFLRWSRRLEEGGTVPSSDISRSVTWSISIKDPETGEWRAVDEPYQTVAPGYSFPVAITYGSSDNDALLKQFYAMQRGDGK
jgi:hypothetical protein